MQIDPTHPFADFRNFVFAVWQFLNLPAPTPVQYDISWFLQHGPKREGIEAFRGVGKSFLTSAFVVWCLFWDCNLKIMVISASEARANAFSQFCLRLIREMPELQHMEPTADQRRSLQAFDVRGAQIDHSPSVKSVGITGQLTGSRADIIVADDVETPKNSQTQLQREKLEELVKEFDAVLKPLPTSRIIYLGTPQCEDSLYNKLAEKGYMFRIWPARKPSQEQVTRYAGKLAPYIENLDIPVGATVEPSRFTDEDLIEREISYGRSGFALQFMLDTSLSDALKFPLKCSDFIVMDIDRSVAPVKVSYGSSADQLIELPCAGLKGDRWYGPMYVSKDFIEFEGSVMFIDPSGRGADKTAYAVVKMANGTLYVRRCGSLAGGYDETTLTALARIAQAEQVNEIVVESNFGDGMFAALLKPILQRHHPCSITGVHNSKQKELRIIEVMEPVLNAHRLVIDKAILVADQGAEVSHSLVYQLTRLTKEKNALAHDDLIDALAGAVAYWITRIDIDVDKGEENHRQAALDREIEEFLANSGLSINTVACWSDNV
jgi:predicted phage terminase large subunit-like protein